MAFGRQKSQEAGAGEDSVAPEEESRVVVEAAARAREVAPLLIVAAQGSRTLVAAGRIEAGVSPVA